MKLPKTILMLSLVTAIVGSSVTANAQDDGRLFGNGRFLRRLTGQQFQPKPQPKQVQPPRTPTKAVPGIRQPAKSTSRATPTPARKPGQPNFAQPNFNKPTLANPNLRKPSANSRPTALNSTRRESTPSRDVRTHLRDPAPSDRDQELPPLVTKSAKKTTMGFGMLIETRDNKMVVTKIDPKGNAHKAGVRAGDQVVGAGGVKLESMDEFNGITGILGEGDQLEFIIVRRGQKQERLIQFGKTPEVGDVAPGEVAARETTSRSARVGTGLRSVMNESSTRQPTTASRTTPVLNQTIQQQRQEIERMRLEIQRLRQSQSASTIEPANPVGRTILNGPALSGPKR